jgi:hypothetical protein
MDETVNGTLKLYSSKLVAAYGARSRQSFLLAVSPWSLSSPPRAPVWSQGP